MHLKHVINLFFIYLYIYFCFQKLCLINYFYFKIAEESFEYEIGVFKKIRDILANHFVVGHFLLYFEKSKNIFH